MWESHYSFTLLRFLHVAHARHYTYFSTFISSPNFQPLS